MFRRLQQIMVATAVVLTPAVAHAAAPPSPGLQQAQPAWIGFIFMFLLTLTVLAVSLMPSKRSHQD